MLADLLVAERGWFERGCYAGRRLDCPLALATVSVAESRVCRSAHARAMAKIENMPTIAAMTSMVETGIKIISLS